MKTPKLSSMNYKSESLSSLPILDPHQSEKIHLKGFRENLFHSKEQAKSHSLLLKQTLIESISFLQSKPEKLSRVKLAYKALETYINSTSFFQKELSVCLQELYPAIFCDKSQLSPSVIEWIYDNHDSSVFETDSVFLQIFISDYLSNSLKNLEAKYKELERVNRSQNESLKEKSNENENLRFECIKILENKQDGDEAKNQLKLALAKIVAGRETCEKKVRSLTENLDDLNNQLLVKEEIIKKQEILNEKHSLEINDMLEEIENKEKEINVLQNENKKLSGYIKALIGKIKAVNRENVGLGEELREAEKKIQELFVRGSGGYTNLTPRPDLTRLMPKFEANNVAESTAARCEFILNNLLSISTTRKRTIARNNTKINN